MHPTADDTPTLPGPTAPPIGAPDGPAADARPEPAAGSDGSTTGPADAVPAVDANHNSQAHINQAQDIRPAELPSLPASGRPSRVSGPTDRSTPSTPSRATLSLDGALPRLATTAAPSPTPPVTPSSTARPTTEAATPSLPTTPEPTATAPSLPTTPAPHLTDAAIPVLPDAPTPTVPTTNPSEPAAEAGTVEAAPKPANAHPMAHLMPEQVAPSEASTRAARIRAAKKAKAKKIKIGVAIGALALAVLAGPPLFEWFGNAIDETGSITPEEPAG